MRAHPTRQVRLGHRLPPVAEPLLHGRDLVLLRPDDARGQPALVGTTSIETSELLSEHLRKAGVNAEIFPVSSVLRLHAAKEQDAELRFVTAAEVRDFVRAHSGGRVS